MGLLGNRLLIMVDQPSILADSKRLKVQDLFKASKGTQMCATRVFFRSYSLQLRQPIKMFTYLLFSDTPSENTGPNLKQPGSTKT